MDSRNKVFTGAACLGVAGILLYQFLSAHQQVYWLSVLFLGILMFVCESLGENLHTRGTSTYGITVLVAALLALNTPSAMMVALCGALSLQDLKTKKNLWVMVFNGVQYALGLAAAAFVYHALGGSSRAFELGETLKSIPILLLAMLVFWIINSAMTSLANYLEYGLQPRDFFKKDALKLLPNYIFYSLLGMALGIIYAQNAFHNVYLNIETGVAVTESMAATNPEAFAGPLVAGTAAQAFLGFAASLFFLTVLGVAWYFSGRNLELLRTYDQATVRLVKYLEGREPYLPGHAERVAYYAQMMAQRLKMSYYDQNKLRYAALLHDMGKVAVPRDVLLQKGPLTEEEFRSVQQHALLGGNWLEEVPFLVETAGAILHHHEYYDGGGYLDGISGDTIPLNARILAVADAYDAMLSPRPWRGPKTPEAAAAELMVNSGIQFDPELVKVFLASLAEYHTAGSAKQVMEAHDAAIEAEAAVENAAAAARAARTEAQHQERLSGGKGRMSKRRRELIEERQKRRERLERSEADLAEKWKEDEGSLAEGSDTGTSGAPTAQPTAPHPPAAQPPGAPTPPPSRPAAPAPPPDDNPGPRPPEGRGWL